MAVNLSFLLFLFPDEEPPEKPSERFGFEEKWEKLQRSFWFRNEPVFDARE